MAPLVIAVDLDGVLWRGSETIPGAPAAIESLTTAGHRVVFVTNDARSPAAKLAQLTSHGVTSAQVVTSAEAASFACREVRGPIALLGDPSLREVFEADSHEVVDLRETTPPPPGVVAVVVGSHHDWDRSRIGWAATLVRDGAKFVATNDDPTFPASEAGRSRLLPGNGALVAAVETASGRRAEVAGKPHAPMVNLLADRYGRIDVVIGDQPKTDGRLAAALDARFGLVLSGVTAAADLPVEPPAALIADDLAHLASMLLGA